LEKTTLSETIDTLLQEDRKFAPSADFIAQANANDASIYETADADWQGWWASWADQLDWFKKWETVCEWEKPYSKWFLGGKLNACFNAVDRHVLAGRGDRTAWIAEGEPGDIRVFTYADVLAEVQKVANALKELGIKRGDRVCIYLGQGPELCLAMLACARIGRLTR
jgi:acetyl-CoA synthetase